MGFITTREAAGLSNYTQHHTALLICKRSVEGRKLGQVWQVSSHLSLEKHLEQAKNSSDGRTGPGR